jgi:hypothetical protein
MYFAQGFLSRGPDKNVSSILKGYVHTNYISLPLTCHGLPNYPTFHLHYTLKASRSQKKKGGNINTSGTTRTGSTKSC